MKIQLQDKSYIIFKANKKIRSSKTQFNLYGNMPMTNIHMDKFPYRITVCVCVSLCVCVILCDLLHFFS